MNIKRLLFLAPVLVSIVSYFSCGTGGSSDAGVSVVISATVSNYSQIDLINKIDNDENGICETYTIPTDDFIEVNFKSTIPENVKIQPSDVITDKCELTYRPKTKNVPVLHETVNCSCLIPAGQTTTCSFSIFKSFNKCAIYNSDNDDSYDVDLVIHGKEVIYDRDITISVGTTVEVRDFQKEGEPNCTFSAPLSCD
ncbi:MAG: hypothetical protein D6831_03195 [Aquificota bacterium]|nr:MAG: hypothetical protein D6831_03195 [Aquificota bacterium]